MVVSGRRGVLSSHGAHVSLWNFREPSDTQAAAWFPPSAPRRLILPESFNTFTLEIIAAEFRQALRAFRDKRPVFIFSGHCWGGSSPLIRPTDARRLYRHTAESPFRFHVVDIASGRRYPPNIIGRSYSFLPPEVGFVRFLSFSISEKEGCDDQESDLAACPGLGFSSGRT
jgi:hypothetical protein